MSFEGFPRETFNWFSGLEADNSEIPAQPRYGRGGRAR